MTNYLKLDAPKYKEGDDTFKYVKAIKTIADGVRDQLSLRLSELVVSLKPIKHKTFS